MKEQEVDYRSRSSFVQNIKNNSGLNFLRRFISGRKHKPVRNGGRGTGLVQLLP